jgi:ribosomal protein S21|tara:strand:+ start:141 stop:365 length:225 start_codon:yes stop_codon:yes gene_type:complete
VPTNVRVDIRRGEHPERLIRRFIKKCKKEKVIERYRARTDHYIKPSVKRKLKSAKARREEKKLQNRKNRRGNKF